MKKHDEQLFEQLIRHASGEWLDEMADDSSEDIRTQNDLSFSSGFLTWADELIKKEDRRERRWRLSARLKKTGQRVAVVACILIAVCSLAAFSIPPVRIALTNLLIEQADDYYGMSVDTAEKNTVSILGYVPEGFKAISVIENENALFIVLENDGHQTIRFERLSGKIDLTVDSESTGLESVLINGLSGFYTEKNGEQILIFNDDTYSYKFTAPIEKDEIVKMAEQIKK